MFILYFQAFDAGCAPFFMILFVLILVFGVPVTLIYKVFNKLENNEKDENPLSLNEK